MWWHVAGAAAVILILFLVPEHHASFSDVFAKTVNNSGMFGGSTSGWGFLLFVLPISAILTQYTITGYDASAHLSEETKSAANGRPGHLAVDLLFRPSAAGSCCCPSCSRFRTPTECPRAAAPSA